MGTYHTAIDDETRRATALAELKAKASAVGIVNIDEIYAKSPKQAYMAVAMAQPDFKARKDPHNHWVDVRLREMGAKFAPVGHKTDMVQIDPIFQRAKNGEPLSFSEWMLLQKAGLL